MKKIVLLFTSVLFLASCSKTLSEADLNGTWIEIDNKTDMNPTGCNLEIDRSEESISICDISFIQPANVVTMTSPTNARLKIENGQIYYKQHIVDVLWIAPLAHKDHYFIDYAFEGQFLWINTDSSEEFSDPTDTGRLFIKN